MLDTPGTLEAGSVRSLGRNLRVLRVFAVRFFLVAAELLRVYIGGFKTVLPEG
jgi:hypothetical protein